MFFSLTRIGLGVGIFLRVAHPARNQLCTATNSKDASIVNFREKNNL